MTAAALDFTYQYPFASSVGISEHGFGLQLATCGARQEHPHFFEGRLRDPRSIGDMLLVLSDVVRTHFFLQRPALLDPVVTSNEEMIRFEGFSGCCGVYARADLPSDAFESDFQHRGTTNVDFNNPMRAALIRLRDRDNAWLSVGQDEVVLKSNQAEVVEKKVKLPVRWIKGFCEVQAYQPGMQLHLEVPGNEARRFFRTLPRSGRPKQPCFVTQWGKILRMSPRTKSGAVRIIGLDRIRVLEPLLAGACKMRIWYDEDTGTSGWEVMFAYGSFFLMVSPELYRGFSGEGQVLKKLATGNWRQALPQVQAQLTWQAQIDTDKLTTLTGCDNQSVEAALAVLGSRGLAGYDLSSGRYFHRVLPFDLARVEQMHPRLKGARQLLEEGCVTLIKQNDDGCEYAVEGSGVHHSVSLMSEGEKCTCPWFSKHLGQRGPCKHILAAQMTRDKEEESYDA